MSTDDEILLDIAPSIFRRGLAIGALLLLGVVLIALAFGDTPDIWRLFFVAFGAAVLWSCNHLYRSTADGLQLTPAGLRTRSGRMLVAAQNIEKVERGVFAFKPSNGFLVRLKTPEDRGWAPGLWWKFGRRLGVGGTLSGGQTRAMADLMAAMVLEQDES